MNPLILLAAAQSGGQVQQIAQTFGVDWTHLIAQIISFSIVCFLLQRFAYKPVLRMLEDRRRQIEEGIANAKKIADDLAQAEKRREEMLTQTNDQIAKLIEEARASALKVKDEETQKAIAAAEQILAKAREAAQQDHSRMLADLKRELGRLVIQATTTVTGKILTPEDQRRLDEETAAQLAA
ncbi:MAG TPA: F0F1 ATP synthase subunit B [Silvibacterium sp.]|nr:F0F1 ATP synthase subunit B [Silvibacterium sp.]